MGWLFGGPKSEFDKKIPDEGHKVLKFPIERTRAPGEKIIPFRPPSHAAYSPPPPETDHKMLFEAVPFESFLEVLKCVVGDLTRHEVIPGAGMVIVYDRKHDQLMWYQTGFTDEEAEVFFDFIDTYYK